MFRFDPATPFTIKRELIGIGRTKSIQIKNISRIQAYVPDMGHFKYWPVESCDTIVSINEEEICRLSHLKANEVDNILDRLRYHLPNAVVVQSTENIV